MNSARPPIICTIDSTSKPICFLPFFYTIIFIISLRFAYILIIWFLHGTVNKNCVNTQALHTFNIGLPTRQGHKRVDTCGFHPLVNHPFPLDSLAQIADM